MTRRKIARERLQISAPQPREHVAARLLDLLDQRRELTGCQRHAAAREQALGCFRPQHGLHKLKKLLMRARAVEAARAGSPGTCVTIRSCCAVPAAATRTRAGQLRG